MGGNLARLVLGSIAFARYVMFASIRCGELPALLGLQRRDWHFHERCTIRGACRLVARRKWARPWERAFSMPSGFC